MSRRHAAVLSFVSIVAACAGAPERETPPPPPPPAGTGTGSSKAPPPAAAFENPGGMWTPAQIAGERHQKQLKALGLAVDPAALGSPTSPLLQAVVSLGGCSASFISPD